MSFTQSQKTKWFRLKQEIIKRPFLAYKIGLTAIDIEDFFSVDFSNEEKLEEIDRLLILEREKKLERLRPILTKVVGYRGSVQFAEKVGTDGMTIKYIIDRKSKPLSHDLISNIEIFLSYVTDFEVSLDNENDVKNYIPNRVDSLKVATANVAERLNSLSTLFEDVKAHDKKVKKEFAKHYSAWYRIEDLQNTLTNSIRELERIRLELHSIVDNLIKQP